MKVHLLFLSFVSLFAIPHLLPAQIEWGAHGGIHSNKVRVDGISESWLPENTYWTAFTGGLQAKIPLQNGFAFTPQLNYTEKGFRVRESMAFDIFNVPVPIGAEAITRVQYIEVPLLMRYEWGNDLVRPYLFAGPHVSYAIDGQIDFRATAIIEFNLGSVDLDMTDNLYNQFEIGGIAGAGIAFTAGTSNVFLQASYQHGFTDMLDDPIINIRVRNSGFNITAGVAVPF